MSPSVLSETSYTAIQSTIATSVGFTEFQARFEKAVPPAMLVLSAMAGRPTPWEAVVTMTAEAAPHGFLIYVEAPVSRIMCIAGHHRRTCSYLIGNHVDAERMYRHSPAVMLHSPLRVVLWEDESGQAMFTFDHPGAQLSCFSDPQITAVGAEITEKFAGLLAYLELPLPDSLRGNDRLIYSQGQTANSALSCF